VTGSINLGCGRGHSVFEVVQAVREVTGEAIPARVEARRPGDPPRLVADARRATTVLGWRPRYPRVEEMIRSAWSWLRAHPTGYGSGGAVSGGVGDAEGEGR